MKAIFDLKTSGRRIRAFPTVNLAGSRQLPVLLTIETCRPGSAQKTTRNVMYFYTEAQLRRKAETSNQDEATLFKGLAAAMQGYQGKPKTFTDATPAAFAQALGITIAFDLGKYSCTETPDANTVPLRTGNSPLYSAA